MKKNQLKISFLAVLLSFNAVGQDDAGNDIFDMDLEDLMNMEVESATKSSISIQKAPSVVRVFTKEDIQIYGFLTIKDILDQIPGTQIQEYRAGHQLTWFRGVQARYNNKVLLLIDGVPMRDSYYGNFLIDDAVPIETIEKVEILNGPGSVLYGANGFAGVISITTKSEGNSIKAEAGSYNQFGVNGEIDSKGLYANVDFHQTDGFDPALNSDGNVRKHDQSATNFGAFTKYTNENFTAVASFSNYDYSYKYRSAKKDYRFNRSPSYGAVNYKKDIGKNSSLNARAYFNNYSFLKEKAKFYNAVDDSLKEQSDEFLNTYLYGGEVEYSTLYKGHDIIIGAALQIDQAVDMGEHIFEDKQVPVNDTDYVIKEELDGNYSNSNIGIYIQDVYEINDKYLFTGGVRYNILNNFDNQFNYRLGLTGMFTKNFYGKLLFGNSYRVPSYREYIDAAAYNDDLQPEKLQTLEAQIGYVMPKGDINLTLYHNSYKNFIQEIVVDSVLDPTGMREVDDEMAFNFDSRSTTGIEIFGTLRPLKGLNINLGSGIIINATETMGNIDTTVVFTSQDLTPDKTDITFLSAFTFNTAISYNILGKVRVGVKMNYFSDRNTPSNYQSDVDSEVQNKELANGFVKLDAFASAKIYKGLSVSANANNLTDANIYSPPYGGSDGYDIEWPGRNYRVSLKLNF